MNHFFTSAGERVSKKEIDRRIREAKLEKLEMFREENNTVLVWCEVCGVSETEAIIDFSHDISVDKCQKTGKCEFAWNVDYITFRCRDCHRKYDKTTIG